MAAPEPLRLENNLPNVRGSSDSVGSSVAITEDFPPITPAQRARLNEQAGGSSASTDSPAPATRMPRSKSVFATPALPAIESDGPNRREAFGAEKRGTVSVDIDEKSGGVKQSIYLTWIKGELDSEGACLELPFTIILLVAFSCLAIMHLNQSKVFLIEASIERDIVENANFAWSNNFGHKALQDVNSVGDYWAWLRLGFLPLIVQQSWGLSETIGDATVALYGSDVAAKAADVSFKFGQFATPLRGDYLHYNRIIGGLRFRQELGLFESPDECRWPSVIDRGIWSAWYGKPCSQAQPDYGLIPFSPVAEDFATPERVEWMYTDGNTSLADMIAQVVDMEDGCSLLPAKGQQTCRCKWCAANKSPWLTELTQRIEISFLTYNAQYGLMTTTNVNFFFNRAGFIHKRVELMSSWLDPWSVPNDELIPMVLCDAIWIFMLVFVAVNELKEMIHVIRASPERWYRSLHEDYVAFWNMVDWISIVIASVMAVSAAKLQVGGSQATADFDLIVAKRGQLNAATMDAYFAAVNDFYDFFEHLCGMERMFRQSLCIYPMVVMLRLFKSFAAQPRLAVVTATLTTAGPDMFHFFIVLLSVFCCLCVNALLIFGQNMEEFSTFSYALHTCFRLMFTDWDWDRMAEVRRNQAMVFFWLFILIMVVILLNMLLAIIMEAYNEVKKKSQGAVTLQKQMYEIYRRRQQYKQKERVRLNDIWDAFSADANGNEKEMLQSDRMLTVDALQKMVDGIPINQAKRTLKNSMQAHVKKEKISNGEEFYELEQAKDKIEDIDHITKKFRDAAFKLHAHFRHYDTAPAIKSVLDDPTASVSLADTDRNSVSPEVLSVVNNEVSRLSTEMANILAQMMKVFERRQNHLEMRQGAMLSSVREMNQKLQLMQSEATTLATRLQRYAFQRKEARQLAQGRGGVGGWAFAHCSIENCNTVEAPSQAIRNSTRGLPP